MELGSGDLLLEKECDEGEDENGDEIRSGGDHKFEQNPEYSKEDFFFFFFIFYVFFFFFFYIFNVFFHFFYFFCSFIFYFFNQL